MIERKPINFQTAHVNDIARHWVELDKELEEALLAKIATEKNYTDIFNKRNFLKEIVAARLVNDGAAVLETVIVRGTNDGYGFNVYVEKKAI